MKSIEKLLAPVLALFLVFAVLAKKERSVPGYPERKKVDSRVLDLTRAPELAGHGTPDITRLVDKVAKELQSEKEEKLAKETKKAEPYPAGFSPAPKKTVVGHKVEVPRRVLEAWAADKDAGLLFGAHAIAGRGISFEELERQKRVRCAEVPGVNYWSCRPDVDAGKFFCVDCYQVQVRGTLKDLGSRRWEPHAPPPRSASN